MVCARGDGPGEPGGPRGRVRPVPENKPGRLPMPEYRRILLDGSSVQVRREGTDLVAGDGRRVAAEDAVHLPPVVPSKIVAVHLNHRSPVAGFQTTPPP